MHDYVIVGAGSAGCVVANRLSEDPDVSVLLLEAGGPDTPDKIEMPIAFSALYRSSYDWDYDTHHEPNAGNRRIFLPRGKTYGGSSSMNAMIYIRGNPVDYDEWDVPASRGLRCSPRSGSPRTTNAARTISTASAGRCG